MTAANRKRQQEHIRYWRQSAARDWKTATDLFRLRHYDWCLFVAHLAIEKLLKALIERDGKEPPKLHDLVRLAFIADIELSDERKDRLGTITRFNIEARYREDKSAFYKLANKAFATTWLAHCQEEYTWLHEQLD